MQLRGRHIILGITGGIAAYKSAALIRLLIREGAEVKVVMTPTAMEFITPVTLSALSKNPVYSEFFYKPNGIWNSHVDLGLWADLLVIAPATANTLAKMATGVCDNLLLTTYLSARCPVMVAPAMDTDMYKHPSLQQNLKTLQARGCTIIEPPLGELASGLTGKGRMEEPDVILNHIISFFSYAGKLCNRKILVTAGPTVEPIDPVRFISNRSSGKTGFFIAESLARAGAEVTLVTGPTEQIAGHKNILTVGVQTAAEMFNACVDIFPRVDGAILSAAVSDYTPETVSATKIKHSGKNTSLKLKPAKDIALHLGKMKMPGQVLAGFALESENEIKNARLKLKEKNFDFIVLNSLKNKGTCFDSDFNKVTIINRNNKLTEFELRHKSLVADDIVNELIKLLK